MHPAMPAYFTRGYVRQVQMALNEKTKSTLPTTGRFNAAWVVVLKKCQILCGILPTGKYDSMTQAELEPFMMRKYLQPQDYDDVAELLGCDSATILAVAKTFMTGSGFISNGKCRITFNRNKFSHELRKQRSNGDIAALHRKYPSIVSDTSGGYLCEEYEYIRFCEAIGIDSYSAMKSTHWGMFQIPGANYRQCGYSTLTSFGVDMQQSERHQLFALARFIKASPVLAKALKEKKWEDFCREYAGAGYKTYQFHLILAANYKDLSLIKMRTKTPA